MDQIIFLILEETFVQPVISHVYLVLHIMMIQNAQAAQQTIILPLVEHQQ